MGQRLYETLVSELEAVTPIAGLIMTDILDMPDTLRQLVNWVLRRKHIDHKDLAEFLGTDSKEARYVIELLVDKGFLEETKEADRKHYRIRTSTVTHTTERRKPPPDLWEYFEEEPPKH